MDRIIVYLIISILIVVIFVSYPTVNMFLTQSGIFINM